MTTLVVLRPGVSALPIPIFFHKYQIGKRLRHQSAGRQAWHNLCFVFSRTDEHLLWSHSRPARVFFRAVGIGPG